MAKVEQQILKDFEGLQDDVKKIKSFLEKPVNGGAQQLVTVAATAIDHKEEGKWGFKSFGHWLREVRQAGVQKSATPALQKAIESAVKKSVIGANEGIGNEGGFFVPPTFSSEIFSRVYADSALLSRTDNYTVTGNSMVFPRNSETSRATGSRWGGIRVYWVDEGAAGTTSKPGFGRLELRLHKLMALAGVTQELLDDAGMAMPTYLNKAFSSEIDFTISDSILRGTGAGMPQGILNAPCKVSVSKESGQAAATILTNNIVKMYARLFKGSREKAVWFVNQDVVPQLYTLAMPTGTYSGAAVFLPPGGFSDKPYATLLGLPVIEIEQAETLGTEGDIVLADLSQYVTISKGGPSQETSIHFYFDSDQQAFRMTYRMDGQPWWASAITPYKGTNTQSCVVTLATRS